MIPAPRNALVSFHYFGNHNLDKLAGLRLIGDSGAFSAASQGVTITTKDLARWAHRWRHRLAWVAALDVIGDPAATRRNWHELVDVHGVAAVPTIHYGDDPALMDYYADRGVDFLGLGGMVAHGGSRARLLRWLVQVFKHQRRHWPQVRFHGWGVSSPELLRLPFFSVDSSGWGSAYRYARLTLRDPRTNALITARLDGRDVYRPEVAKLLHRHYGVAPSQVARSTPANRPLLIRISALAASVNEQHMRRTHGVIPAPAWGDLSRTDGPHLHLATANSGIADQLAHDRRRADGPHLHLAEGAAQNLELVAAMDGPHLHLADTDPGALAGIAETARTHTTTGPHPAVSGRSPDIDAPTEKPDAA
ncbi:hypothetical protein [Nocardia transvalensis]|uniref:hypothetical protein n=1 Tax=Nocardia transvalensis TaxID=37333 RepID=UPI0018962BC1|nr:hypothetical protein [Nocardia transvalensis]MBF6332405.1 hypothetical protein [Nocardia transvalensis]